MDTNLVCYLYYHSFSNRPSPILLFSISHYSYFFADYILVTNLAPAAFPQSIRNRITIVHPDSIESEQSIHITNKLQNLWSTNQLRANCPSVEIHCFRRWLMLRDLYLCGYLDSNCLVFSHDWDDLLFMSLPDIIKECREIGIAQESGQSVLVSCTPEPVQHALQPHFLLTNKASIHTYCLCIEELSNKFIRFHPRHNFSDMVPWAYVYHRAKITSSGSYVALWSQLFYGELYFCDNIRSLLFAPHLATRRFLIPPEYSCLPPDAPHLEVIAFYISPGGKIFVSNERDYTLLPAVNAQYQGTEGKFIMMYDAENLFVNFYRAHPGLLCF